MDSRIKSKDGQKDFQMQMENDHRCWILVKTAKEGGYEAWARDSLNEFFFVIKINGRSIYDFYLKPWYSAFMMAKLKWIYWSYLDNFMYSNFRKYAHPSFLP